MNKGLLILFPLLLSSTYTLAELGKFEKAVSDEDVKWLINDSNIKALNCASFTQYSELENIKGYSITVKNRSFNKTPLLPEGKVQCYISRDSEEDKTASIVSKETGFLDGVSYSISLDGADVVGTIGDHSDQERYTWDLECEQRQNGVSICFVGYESYRFYIQRIPKLSADIPAGYIISNGKTMFRPIIEITLDGKEIKAKNESPVLVGKQAKELVDGLKSTSSLKVLYKTPSDRIVETSFEPQEIANVEVAIKILNAAYDAYNK